MKTIRPYVVRKQSSIAEEVIKFLKFIIWALVLVLIFAFLFKEYKIRSKDYIFYPLKTVEITPKLNYGSAAEIEEIIRSYHNPDLLNLNVQSIAIEINGLSWVKQAKVEKKWPDRILVSLQEREPVYRFEGNEFLDADGKRFQISQNHEHLQKLFQVVAPKGQELTVLKMTQIIEPWLRSNNLKPTKIELDDRQAWHIHFNEIDVLLGREALHRRLKSILLIFQDKNIRHHLEYIKKIDLRYSNNGYSIQWKNGITPRTASDTKNKGGK